MTTKRIIHIVICTVLIGVLSHFAYAWHLTNNRPEKIWLHRCNSIEKVYEMEEDYQCFEVDVCIRPNGMLDVTHDLDTTFHLDLKKYFAFLSENPKRKLWLDIKNLTKENISDMKRELKGLMDAYDIGHDHLIIESPKHHLLRDFTNAGFYTSCYVTAPRPTLFENETVDSIITQYDKIANSGNVSALSFPSYWYTHFHDQYKDTDIEFLTWAHHTGLFGLALSPSGLKMLNDERLRVILIRDKGNYHR